MRWFDYCWAVNRSEIIITNNNSEIKKMNKRIKIFAIILLTSFLFFLAYRKHLNNEFNRNFNLKFNKQWELEYAKTHTNIINTLNGEITYSYSDSTKTIKTQVNKKKYENYRYNVFWDTDSIELDSKRPFVQIVDISRTMDFYNGIKFIEVFYKEDLNRNWKKIEIGRMSIGYGCQFIPSKRGIGEIKTVIESVDGHKENFDFRYVIF